MIFSFNLRQDKTRQDKIYSTLSLDKSQMYPIDVFPLWPRCCHNYPVLFLPKLRQDKTTILDSRLTDYTIPTLTFPTHEQSRAEQSNANDPPYDDDDQDKQDKMPYDDLLTFSVPDTWRCFVLSPLMLFVDADPTRELSFLTIYETLQPISMPEPTTDTRAT